MLNRALRYISSLEPSRCFRVRIAVLALLPIFFGNCAALEEGTLLGLLMNAYKVGGTVSGLNGTGLVVRNNGGNDRAISTDGEFTFSSRVALGGAYSVTVASQPATPAQVCTVAFAAGTIDSTLTLASIANPGPLSGLIALNAIDGLSPDVKNVAVTCATDTLTVGGTVTGLAGGTLVLRNNGGDDKTITANGAFTFDTALANGSGYAVTVLTQPSGPAQTCTVANAAGTVSGVNVTNIAVTCSTTTYTIGGTVSGLTGGTLVLQNNAGDDESRTANGAFTFTTALANGATYAVTVLTQPGTPNQTCTVANATGTLAGANITNVAVTCTPAATLDDGPVISDPFGDATPSGQLFVFNDKLYVGPNTAETAVFEMSADMTTTTTITIDGDGTPGAPFTSFVGLPNASGTNLGGIDNFYSACVGASPATLTGVACTGTEYNFITGYVSTGGNYESVWTSSDTGGTRTYTQRTGMETGGNAYRTMSMAAFKDQLYVVVQHQGSSSPKFSRVCLKAGGCDNGDTQWQANGMGGDNLPRIGKGGTPSQGQPSGRLVSIDSMWEYDNDGAGGNQSQLYIAAGGSTGGAGLPQANPTHGGILRTQLLYSTTANPPTGADGVFFQDVTPTNAKWLAYMSIALPEDATAGKDWSALIPANRVTPAIKAIPYMRTAPNGDLYLIRNACSGITVHNVAAGNFVSNGRQTCPLGSEIPQLWVLPKGTTGSPKGAGDWILVAEAGATGRTDMSTNASCTIGVNQCDTENTHITLLEFNGNFLYIGYDNATFGTNVWRTDLTAVASGTPPTTGSFARVGAFGLGSAANQTRIFSHVTVDAGGTDYLVFATGTGANAVRLFRTANN